MSDFETAKYYTCDDDEVLHYECPEEAILAYLDGIGSSIEQVIATEAPLTVRAYSPKAISPLDIELTVNRIVDDIEEAFGDEYGDPDHAVNDYSDADRAKMRELLTPVVGQCFGMGKMYMCDEVAQRKYSADELLVLVGKECPEWFTDGVPKIRDALVRLIEAEGWRVEFRSWCEDAETPGILGQFGGVTVHDRKVVKVRTEGFSEAQICAVLEHELEHVRGALRGTDRPEHGLRCGGTLGA